jgi:hypothetical protein
MPAKVYEIVPYDFTEFGSTSAIGLMVVIIFEDYLIFLKLIATCEKDPAI